MSGEPTELLLSFDSPARYEIRVKGSISESWSDRVEGMSIRQDSLAGAGSTCILEGELLDQAALIGVLVTIYELHLPLISVECLPESDR
ncbi:MAG: hypothetical protein R3335_01060 [Anaerolineales bacterium]|nr:hypothetical protein [Anaerolineales bacterium]